jgi:hypothetical protein
MDNKLRALHHRGAAHPVAVGSYPGQGYTLHRWWAAPCGPPSTDHPSQIDPNEKRRRPTMRTYVKPDLNSRTTPGATRTPSQGSSSMVMAPTPGGAVKVKPSGRPPADPPLAETLNRPGQRRNQCQRWTQPS